MSTSIKIDEIFKVVLLDNGNIKEYFVFTGESPETPNALDKELKKCRYNYPDTPYPDIFLSIFTENDKRILGDKGMDIEVTFINYRIFIDDTIATITKKIAMAIPELPIDFMYLFVNVNDGLHDTVVPMSLISDSKGKINPYSDEEDMDKHILKVTSAGIKVLIQVNEIIEDNIIFLCTLENVRTYNKGVSDMAILKKYFPVLFKNIVSSEYDIKKILGMGRDKQFEPRNPINADFINKDVALNGIYNTYFSNNGAVKNAKFNCGLTNVVFRINPTGESKTIPIENLFLLLHADKEHPLIKVRLSNAIYSQYRLYAPRNTERVKESYLSHINVDKYDKLMITSKCLTVLFINKTKDTEYTIICEFHNDCAIIINIMKVACDNEINNLMTEIVNPVIRKVKKYLDENGNNIMNEFVSFRHGNIELLNTDLSLKSDTVIDAIKVKELKERMGISFKQGADEIMRYTRVVGYNEPTRQAKTKLSLGRQNAAPNTSINPDDDNKEMGFETVLTSESRPHALKLEIYGITSLRYITIFKIWFNELLNYTHSKPPHKKVAKPVYDQRVNIQVLPPQPVALPTPPQPVALPPPQPVALPPPPQPVIAKSEKPSNNHSFFNDYSDDEDSGGGGGGISDANGGAKAKKPGRTRIKKGEEPVEKKNIFLPKIQQLDPGLFANEGKEDISTRYSTRCQWNWHRQPVVLTNEQKNKIDEKDKRRKAVDPKHVGSYNIALQHNSQKVAKDEDKLWYICPRYWDKDTNESLTHEEAIERGEGKWDNIIPVVDESTDGTTALNGPLKREKGSKPNIIEFIDGLRIKSVDDKSDIHKDNFIYDQNGKQIKNKEFEQFFPGFLKPPKDGPCKPCCFTVDGNNRLTSGQTDKNEWKDGKQQKNRKQCINNVDTEPILGPKESEPATVNSNMQGTENHGEYILGSNKIPMETPNRWGFMPDSVQHLLNVNNIDFTMPKSERIKPGHNCILRHSIPIHNTQSFVNCISFLLHFNGFNGDIKTRILEKVTIDVFITLHNGSILQRCYADYIADKMKDELDDDIDARFETYNTELENSIINKNQNNSTENKITLMKIVDAYRQFKKVINSDIENIDYEYLWEIVCKEDMLFSSEKSRLNVNDNGINLVILHLHRNAISTFVDIICPVNHYMNKLPNKRYTFFDIDKRTVIILKIESLTHKGVTQFHYEPLVTYMYNTNAKNVVSIKTSPFFSVKLDEMRDDVVSKVTVFLLHVRRQWQKKCSPTAFTTGISADQVEKQNKYRSNTIFELIKTLTVKTKVHKYVFVSQVINHNLQVVGAIVGAKIDKTEFFVPCFPSTPMYNISTESRLSSRKNGGKRRKQLADFIWIDDIIKGNYEHSYSDTIDFIGDFSKTIPVKFKYTPKHYVTEDTEDTDDTKGHKLVIGIMTELDQYIPITPIDSGEIHDPYDKYVVKYGYNILKEDRLVSTSSDIDSVRYDDVHNRRIEHKMYEVFSEIVHRVISQGHRDELDLLLMDKQATWYKKLDTVKSKIREWVGQYIIFVTDDDEINTIKRKKNVEISACIDCLTNKTGLCKDAPTLGAVCTFSIPKINLIDQNIDNSGEYYTRVSDDIIRNRRVGAFIGSRASNTYSHIELVVNDDELLLSRDAMNKYFADLKLNPLKEQFNNTYKTGTSDNIKDDKRMDLNEFKIITVLVPIGKVVL